MTLTVRIEKIWDETEEIRCFELRSNNGIALPPAEPGAHIDIQISEGLTRQYSLWNGPEDTGRYFIGVKREPESRGGSSAMHALAQGQSVTISPPRNHFPLAGGEGPHILLAGGIGITPLFAMTQRLEAEGRDHHLHLFARSIDHAPFAQKLLASPAATIHPGLVPPKLNTVLADILNNGQGGGHLYLCGPGPFMDLVRETAANSGWPESRVHLEYFSADPDALQLDGDAFEVVLEKSGTTLVVGSDQTIIEAMEEAGLEVLTSCEQGVCGTCVTNVIEGEPDHRDLYFNAGEHASGKVITPCVSRCKGKRLVLDL
ncbi:2Fe-2S iron-sulfur cluster-binding protein [Hoeflea sp. TYP-13]|uniref:PDR/VanB family oxidoreductase n=1 Tax=Hoeflea sp. TYP-13 TaxID=3230023 RepID=UPI0034C64131